MKSPSLILCLGLATQIGLAGFAQTGDSYPWPHGVGLQTLEARFPPPDGYGRTDAPAGSFAAWLRGLPLVAGRGTVRLHDGRAKANQQAQAAVIAIDTGAKDLQQCADAVMRLRAEYLFTTACAEGIGFRFTSGDPAPWKDWRSGQRPVVQGNRVRWQQRAAADGSYANFRRYLERVFVYAGSASLVRELQPVADAARIRPGDVFIQGGFPGHAVLVVDTAENEAGGRVFLLAQSYMPAQDIHVLRRPGADSPWYPAHSSGPLITPEWRFVYGDLYRFDPGDCPGSP